MWQEYTVNAYNLTRNVIYRASGKKYGLKIKFNLYNTKLYDFFCINNHAGMLTNIVIINFFKFQIYNSHKKKYKSRR